MPLGFFHRRTVFSKVLFHKPLFFSFSYSQSTNPSLQPLYDLPTCIASLQACANHENLIRGQQIHSYMLTNGFLNSPHSITSLINMYSKCNRMDFAVSIFNNPFHDCNMQKRSNRKGANCNDMDLKANFVSYSTNYHHMLSTFRPAIHLASTVSSLHHLPWTLPSLDVCAGFIFYVLEVIDTSGGCGASFTIEIVSEQFEGKRLLERHRLVNTALEGVMKEIHALSIKKAVTPEQWKQQQSSTSAFKFWMIKYSIELDPRGDLRKQERELHMVGTSTGIDHIDISKCRSWPITSTRAGDAFSEDATDYAVVLVIEVLQ
ncbi:hypothetical protein FEM48_Zijuj08G0182500 [Ziziphus jujuba var. spinosa]|uniref:Uncharacterized protein n=1 Tax=Ziziphus jujuba var. spinosa TaxID=714518 RepID=A0A978V0L6_ZIZJJ|nr:hypothetical protein FEM48_Zijuj08G0182500 [Ziziphus jujuba var. spinosa]